MPSVCPASYVGSGRFTLAAAGAPGNVRWFICLRTCGAVCDGLLPSISRCFLIPLYTGRQPGRSGQQRAQLVRHWLPAGRHHSLQGRGDSSPGAHGRCGGACRMRQLVDVRALQAEICTGPVCVRSQCSGVRQVVRHLAIGPQVPLHLHPAPSTRGMNGSGRFNALVCLPQITSRTRTGCVHSRSPRETPPSSCGQPLRCSGER